MGHLDQSAADDPAPGGDLSVMLAAARNGYRESEAQLLTMCRKYLLAIANRDVESGRRPKVAASDAVQETLIESQRDMTDFRGSSEPEHLPVLSRWPSDACLKGVNAGVSGRRIEEKMSCTRYG